jgi:hypothetical protein
MGIVTGDTTELLGIGTGLITATFTHLFGGTYKLEIIAIPAAIDEIHQKQVQRQTGAKVEIASTTRDKALLPLNVALLTNRFTQGVFEFRGVHNGWVEWALVWPVQPRIDMQLSGTVAALTANRKPVEDVPLVLIDRAGHMVDLIGVTEQTLRRNHAVKMKVACFVTGR